MHSEYQRVIQKLCATGNSARTKTVCGGYWCATQKQCASVIGTTKKWCTVVKGVWSMIYLVVFLCMLNMGVQVKICAHEVVWMVNNNEKVANFHNILYRSNVIFLQRVFEGLSNVFSYSKTMREISNGVNHLSNGYFMRKLQHK
jgi:hypothetical protein